MANLRMAKHLAGDILNTLNEAENDAELADNSDGAMQAARGGLCCIAGSVDSLKKITDYLEGINKL